MNAASSFWSDSLHGCKMDRPSPLPFNRHRVSDEYRTGRGTLASFDFGESLSRSFLDRAAKSNTTPQHLALASYYAFLFKLTNGEKDLCIGMNTDGRFKTELISVIGMFVNAIPLRCQLDPNWSFARLVEAVDQMATDSWNYRYFPLQRILAHQSHVSKPTFLDISFAFGSSTVQQMKNDLMLGNALLSSVPFSSDIGTDEIVSKFDFSLNIYHDSATEQLSCSISASLDVFESETINKFAERFHLMLKQLCESSFDWNIEPIYKLSLVLPDENRLLMSLSNISPSVHAVNCIHHEFAYHVMELSQKVAVELDDQSFTYSELLHYAQLLALHLLTKYEIKVGDIICQCVERSLSMVSLLIIPTFKYETEQSYMFRLLVSSQLRCLVVLIVHFHRSIPKSACIPY